MALLRGWSDVRWHTTGWFSLALPSMSCARGCTALSLTVTSAWKNRERVLHDMSAAALWVDVGEPAVYCRDPEDDKFFEAALKAQADYLVSVDKDVLEAPALTGLRIISAQQALKVLAL